MISFRQYIREATDRRSFLKMLSGAAAGAASLGIPSLVKPAVGISGRCEICGNMSTSRRRGMRVIIFPLRYDDLLICSKCWSHWAKYWAHPDRLKDERDYRIAKKKHDEQTRRDIENRARGKRLAAGLPLKTWAQQKLPHTFTSNDRGEYDYDDVVRGVSEARSQPGEPVEGLDRFIEWMELAKGDIMTPGLIADIRAFIDKSGCPKIKFERLSGALGISTEAECVISSGALNSSMTQMLYVIFHELAHQYQYSKHGEDFAGDIFLGDKSALESAKDLLKIENIADRYAHRIVKHLMDKHNLKFDRIHLVYKNYTPAEIAVHVNGVRNMVKQQGLTTVEAVNQFIYNMIKTVVKPTIKTRTDSSSTNDK